MNAARFERALARSARQAGVTVAVESHRATAWHSATFSGERHEMVVTASAGPALDGWAMRVPGLDLGMPGHLLADLRVAAHERVGQDVRLQIDGLTVAVA